MRISTGNFQYINKIRENNESSKPNSNSKSLSSDVFERSQSSFGSSFLEHIYEMSCIISGVFEQQRNELRLAQFLEVLSMKDVQKLIAQAKMQRVDDIIFRVYNNIGSDGSFVSKAFSDANIKTGLALNNFIRTYCRNPETRKIFKGQDVEALKIYGLLNSKEDLASYSELLLYLYNQEEDSENPDFDKINTTLGFLKQIGLNHFSDFEDRYSYLKDRFNNFDSISDKYDAIVYLQQTYDDKIAQIGQIVKEKPKTVSQSEQKIYSMLYDIIDYLYLKNNGQSLKPLDSVMEIAMQSGKIKSNVWKNIGCNFNDFQKPEDKLDFFLFMEECNLTASDVNCYANKSIISDADILNNMIEADEIIGGIAAAKDIDSVNAKKIYSSLSNLFTAVCNQNDDDAESIKNLLNVIDNYNISSESSMLDFYNRINGCKSKSISSDEFCNFIELFRYYDSKTLLQDAKKQNVLPIQLLKNEKAAFDAVKDKIEQVILSDTTGILAGKTPIELYRANKDLIVQYPEDTQEIIENSTGLYSADNAEYQEKVQEFQKFTPYFDSHHDLMKFISVNNIKFDNSKDDEEFRNNCLKIFEILYEEDNKEESLEYIKYYSESMFLQRSKKKLSGFLATVPPNCQKSVLKLFADKKVPSLNAISKYNKAFFTKSSESKSNLLQHLELLPDDVEFSEDMENLFRIQHKLNEFGISLNNDNILRIDPSRYIGVQKFSAGLSAVLVNKIQGGSDDENFVQKLPEAFKEHNVKSSGFRIAKELVDKIGTTDESYSNIARVLKLDKKSLGLNTDCSDYIYIKRLEEVLPKEFIDFVNSDDWFKYDENSEKIPNLSLHAKLRAIDRFALCDKDDISSLYSQETKEKLKKVFKAIYCDNIVSLKSRNDSKRIVTNVILGDMNIESVFSQQGELITLIPKRSGNV